MQNEKSHSGVERRNYLREPMQSLAYVRLGEENGGIIVNLGEDGLAVRAAVALPYDRVPVLLFQLAGFPHPVVTSGRIAWKGDSGKLVGIQFVDMHESMRNIIKSWLAEENSLRAPCEPEFPAHLRDDLPAEPPSNIVAVPGQVAGAVQNQIISKPFSVAVPAGPPASFDAPNSSLAPAAVPRAVSPLVIARSANLPHVFEAPAVDIVPAAYVSHRHRGRTALLIAVFGALCGMAGWAIGRGSLSRAFSGTPHSNVVKTIAPVAAVADVGNPPASVRQVPQVASLSGQGWIFLGRITAEATWAPNSPENVRSVPWPIKKGDRITTSNDVSMHGDSGAFNRSSAPVVGILRFGETVLVEEVTLSRARLGGDFVWTKVSASAVQSSKFMPRRTRDGIR
jgi:PilZ domain